MKQPVGRILVVDDEPMICTLTANAMRNEGLICECATDAPSALRKFRDHPCDLAVIDLRLPGKNGHTLTTELMQQEQAPWIVVLTAVCEPRLIKDLYARGVDDVVFKPVNYAAFATKIKVLVERHLQAAATASDSKQTDKQVADLLQNVCEIENKVKSSQANETDFLYWLSVVDPCKLPESALTGDEFERSYPEPSLALQKIARSLSVQIPLMQDDHRGTPRVPLIVSVIAAEVNGNRQIVSRPFRLLARDFSLAGIGFLHDRSIETPFLGIAWKSTTGECLTALIEILRCENRGDYFDIGGRFVEKTT